MWIGTEIDAFAVMHTIDRVERARKRQAKLAIVEAGKPNSKVFVLMAKPKKGFPFRAVEIARSGRFRSTRVSKTVF